MPLIGCQVGQPNSRFSERQLGQLRSSRVGFDERGEPFSHGFDRNVGAGQMCTKTRRSTVAGQVSPGRELVPCSGQSLVQTAVITRIAEQVNGLAA